MLNYAVDWMAPRVFQISPSVRYIVRIEKV